MPTEVIVLIVIIQIAVLVVFFIMASNVAKIKSSINAVAVNVTKIKSSITTEVVKEAETYVQEAKLAAYVGDAQAAIRSYLCARYRYEKKYESYMLHGDDISDRRIAEIDEAIAKLQD